MTDRQPTECELGEWRLIGGRACAWFEAPSQSAGAALVARLADADAGDGTDYDLRPNGVRIRREPDQTAMRMISSAAAEVGLRADPSALAELGLVIESTDPALVQTFWQSVLGYQPASDGGLSDRLRRDPAVRFVRIDEPRPLRNRLHLDVGAPSDRVLAVRDELGQQPHGPFSVALADRDGNEVDLCPGGPLSAEQQLGDWQTMFSALAFYPADTTRAAALVRAAAELGDAAARPLLIDVRSEGVMIDSGKDQWEAPTGDADPDFVRLATQVQTAARDLGLAARPAAYRFIQIGIDAVDIPAVRRFWQQTLGYADDPRPMVTDLYDPRRLNPVIFFQALDGSDEMRRRQPNRWHLELAVPADRVDTIVGSGQSAGGRLTSDRTAGDRREAMMVDPEGNELQLFGW